MTKFTEACSLLNEIEREAPQLSKQTKELRGLMLLMPLNSNEQPRRKISWPLFFKVFAWLNALPILIISWCAFIGVVVTEQQWFGAIAALVISLVLYPADKK